MERLGNLALLPEAFLNPQPTWIVSLYWLQVLEFGTGRVVGKPGERPERERHK